MAAAFDRDVKEVPGQTRGEPRASNHTRADSAAQCAHGSFLMPLRTRHAHLGAPGASGAGFVASLRRLGIDRPQQFRDGEHICAAPTGSIDHRELVSKRHRLGDQVRFVGGRAASAGWHWTGCSPACGRHPSGGGWASRRRGQNGVTRLEAGSQSRRSGHHGATAGTPRLPSTFLVFLLLISADLEQAPGRFWDMSG